MPDQLRDSNMASQEKADEVPLKEQFPEGATCQNCLHDEYAIAYCHDCKRLLCEDCLKAHKWQVDTHRHHTVDSPKAEELKQLYRCQHHGDKMLDYFCLSCHKPICQHCQVTICKNHDLLVSTDIKNEVKKLLERVKAKREQFSHHAEYIKAKVEQNADALNRCEAEINASFDTAIQELESNRENLLAQLRCETRKNNEKVKEQEDYVSQKIAEMEKTIAQTETLLSTKTDAKMTVKNMELCANLDGQASLEWSRSVATFRSWQLDHKDPKKLASSFSTLLPKPRRESIKVNNHEEARVGIKNVFTITADILDQFEVYNPKFVDGFVSVKLHLMPADQEGRAVIHYEATRNRNVWTVTYILQRHGRVSIEVSVCGVKAWEEPFTLDTVPDQEEIKVKRSLTERRRKKSEPKAGRPKGSPSARRRSEIS